MLTRAPDQYDRSVFQDILNDIERRITTLERAIAVGYSTENVTPSRTLDASTATLDELRQVVGTLIEDMKLRGRLG